MTTNPMDLVGLRWEIGAAFGIPDEEIRRALDDHRRRKEFGDHSQTQRCAFTTQRGTACLRGGSHEISHYLWVCHYHSEQAMYMLPYLIENTPRLADLTSSIDALWDRMQTDEWARHVCNRDLAGHMDSILTERLEAVWGADA